MASVLQPEDTAALIQAVAKARGGAGQAIQAGVQGYNTGAATDVEQRKQALAEQVRGMSVIQPDEAPEGTTLDGPSTPEKLSAITQGNYRYTVGGDKTKAVQTQQQRADTATQGEKDLNDYHRGLLAAKQAELAAKGSTPGGGLTAANKSRQQLATSVLPGLDEYQSLVDQADKQGLIGPAAGRIYATFAKVGTTGDPAKDQLLEHLLSAHTLLASKVGVMHYGARATAQAMDSFKQMFDPSKLSAPMIKGGLDATREFAKGYATMGQPAAPAIPAQAAAAPIPGPAAALQAAQPHPQDATALQWAQQNPNDPRAAKILQLNGAK